MLLGVVLLCAAASAGALKCNTYSEEWATAEFERIQPHASAYWAQFEGRGFQKRNMTERLGLFHAALKRVNAHNSAGEQSYCQKPNHFSTMTAEEKRIMNGIRSPPSHPVVPVEYVDKATLPNEVYHDTGRVENQGSCGSCWSFAASHVLTGTLKRFGGHSAEFSEQQLVDCTRACYGCNGGFSDKALEYWMQNPVDLDNGERVESLAGGVLDPYSQPYEAQQGWCRPAPSTARVITGVKYGPKNNEAALMKLLQDRPTTLYFDVTDSFQHYHYGVYEDRYCDPVHTNHAMTLVGYGTGDQGDYWTVKNSWGTQWGKDGYVQVRRDPQNCGDCGLCDFPIYPTVFSE